MLCFCSHPKYYSILCLYFCLSPFTSLSFHPLFPPPPVFPLSPRPPGLCCAVGAHRSDQDRWSQMISGLYSFLQETAWYCCWHDALTGCLQVQAFSFATVQNLESRFSPIIIPSGLQRLTWSNLTGCLQTPCYHPHPVTSCLFTSELLPAPALVGDRLHLSYRTNN